MNKIYFSILNQNWIHIETAIKLPRWIKECQHDVYLEGSNECPIAHNRNSIVQRFLKSDSTHLLMLDADTVPSKNPLELITFNKDIISVPTPIFQYRKIYNVYQNTGEKDVLSPIEDKGLVEIDATGTGCIMISKKVLECIKAPFERIFDENGIETCGLDIAFSKKAKKEGFRIFTHFDYKAKHYKTIDLNFIK